MKKEKVQDDAFSDEGEMTIEQAEVLLDFIMKQEKENNIDLEKSSN